MDHLSEILVSLADRHVNFIVGGGVAAVLHGVDRVTMDLDIAVQWEEENLRRFLDCMCNLKLKPKVPIDPEVLLDRQSFDALMKAKNAVVFTFRDEKDPIRVVDIFIKPELSFETLSPDSVSVSLYGRAIRIVSAAHLLRLKQAIRPMRPKDELDIRSLKDMMAAHDD